MAASLSRQPSSDIPAQYKLLTHLSLTLKLGAEVEVPSMEPPSSEGVPTTADVSVPDKRKYENKASEYASKLERMRES